MSLFIKGGGTDIEVRPEFTHWTTSCLQAPRARRLGVDEQQRSPQVESYLHLTQKRTYYFISVDRQVSHDDRGRSARALMDLRQIFSANSRRTSARLDRIVILHTKSYVIAGCLLRVADVQRDEVNLVVDEARSIDRAQGGAAKYVAYSKLTGFDLQR